MKSYIKHFRGLPTDRLESEIDGKIADKYVDLIDADAVNGAIAESNATGFMMDTYEIVDEMKDLDLGGSFVDIQISANAVGEQDTDKPYCGDEIKVTATARLDDEGNVEFRDVAAKLNWPDEEDLREAAANNEDDKA